MQHHVQMLKHESIIPYLLLMRTWSSNTTGACTGTFLTVLEKNCLNAWAGHLIFMGWLPWSPHYLVKFLNYILLHGTGFLIGPIYAAKYQYRQYSIRQGSAQIIFNTCMHQPIVRFFSFLFSSNWVKANSHALHMIHNYTKHKYRSILSGPV